MALQQDGSMDIGEQSVASQFAVVEEVVRAKVSEFEAHGFVLTNVTEAGTPPFVRSLVFHFSNAGAGLLLSLSFFIGRSGQRRGFTALISRAGNGRLDVGDYLELHGRSDLSALFTSDDPSANLRSFAESAIRTLLSLFDNELKPVVEGKTFEETPIDWQGYR
jgi:hypothetical protein